MMADIGDRNPEGLAEPDEGAEPDSGKQSRWGGRATSLAPPVASERRVAPPPPAPNLTEVRVITQQAVIDQTGIRPLRAVILHPRLALGIFVAIFIVGITYGVATPTEYEAEVKLIVGRLDAAVEAIPSLVAANEVLAQNYSRLLTSPDLVDDISSRTGLTAKEVRDRVKATQVASSPFIRVTGSGASVGEARDLAEITGDRLMVLANDFASVSTDPDILLQQHDAALIELNLARRDVAEAQVALEGEVTTSQRSDLLDALYVGQAEVDRLQFRVTYLESQFLDTQRATASEGLVRLASDVEDRGSNRLGNVSLGLAVGLLGGIFIAVGLVTMLELVKIAQVEPPASSES